MNYYNDNEPYCCEVLRARVADGRLDEGVIDDRDIRCVPAPELCNYHQVHLFAGIGGIPLGLRLAGYEGRILTAGFPCQDLSLAGRGAGLDGDRSGLFWETLAAIDMVRPPVILLENVAALLHRGLDVVLGSLAEVGYDATWHCVQASDVGAPHLRDRIWISGVLGNAIGERARDRSGADRGQAREPADASEPAPVRQAHGATGAGRAAAAGADVPDATGQGLEVRQHEDGLRKLPTAVGTRQVPDADGGGREVVGVGQQSGQRGAHGDEPHRLRQARPAELGRFAAEGSCYRATQSRIRRVADRSASGVDHDIMGYGTTTEAIAKKEVSQLRGGLDSKKISVRAGRSRGLSAQEILRHEMHGGGPDDVQPEPFRNPETSADSPEGIVRELRRYALARNPSPRRKLEEQRPVELSDTVRVLSYVLASRSGRHAEEEEEAAMLSLWEAVNQTGPVCHTFVAFKEAWQSLSPPGQEWSALAACFGPWHSEWPDIPRVASAAPERMNRLRALGNAVVPQCVQFIAQHILPRRDL